TSCNRSSDKFGADDCYRLLSSTGSSLLRPIILLELVGHLCSPSHGTVRNLFRRRRDFGRIPEQDRVLLVVTSRQKVVRLYWEVAGRLSRLLDHPGRLHGSNPRQRSLLFRFESSLSVRGSRALHVVLDRKSTRLNSSHQIISYAVFCLKKK